MLRIAIVIVAALMCPPPAWPAAERAPASAAIEVIAALAPAVEATAAATRPRHWPMKRACLYYALAGQALLARQGIATRLRLGRVVYRPGTAAAHPIAPHAWLESATHFIDYAALPRWGQVAIIPTPMTAAAVAVVAPGSTRVLAIPDAPDVRLWRDLSHHRRCFQGRWRAWQRDG